MSMLTKAEWIDRVRKAALEVVNEQSPTAIEVDKMSIELDGFVCEDDEPLCVSVNYLFWTSRTGYGHRVGVDFTIGSEAETEAEVGGALDLSTFCSHTGYPDRSIEFFNAFCKAGVLASNLSKAVLAAMKDHICPIPAGDW